MSEGKFIVIEGIDGAGSTTQAGMLVDWLVANGRRCVMTAEPSRGPVGLLIRQILSGRTVVRGIDGEVRPLHNDVISLLFAADRLDHLDNEVLPLVRSGVHVVSDRYYHSSFTYQAAEGDLAWIQTLNTRARIPDVTYILDLPAEEAARRRKRVRAFDELYETDDLQARLRETYRQLPSLLKNQTIVVVDGRPDARTVHGSLLADLQSRLDPP